MAKVFTLGTIKCVLDGGRNRSGNPLGVITPYTVNRFPEQFRTQGTASQSDLTTPDTVVFGAMTGGFGRDRIPALESGDMRNYRRFRDAKADTRWASGIVLPILSQDSTEPSLGQSPAIIGPRDTVTFLGAFYGLFEVAESATSGMFVATHDGTSWDNNKAQLDLTYANKGATFQSGAESTGGTLTITINGVLVATLTHGTDWNGSADAGVQTTNIVNAIIASAAATYVTAEADGTLNAKLTPKAGVWKLAIGGTASGVIKTSPSATIQTGHRLLVHKDKMYALIVDGGTHKVYYTTDGSAWTLATGIGTSLMTAQSAGDNDDAGTLMEIGGELVAVLWHEANNSITFYSSANGTSFSDESVDIITASGVKGVVRYPGPITDDGDKLYVGTQEGLYEVDTALAPWTFIQAYALPSHADNCRSMKLHTDGAVWIPIGVGNNQPTKIIRMMNGGGVRQFLRGFGLDFQDGVPADLYGPIRWLHSQPGMLFASVGGGAAGRNARVICHVDANPDDGEPHWHHMTQHGTADVKIYHVSFDGTRLHYEVRTATATSDSRYMTDAMLKPQHAGSTPRELNGNVDYPEVDGGMPTTGGAFLGVALDAHELSSTNAGDYINVDYDTDDVDWSNLTDMGDILSGTKTLTLASGAGVSATSFATRLNLIRDSGDNTDTPHLHSLELRYEKVPSTLKGFEVQRVDLLASTELNGYGNKPSELLAALEAVRDNAVGQTFQYPGATAVKVRVVPGSWRHELEWNEGGPELAPGDTSAQVAGYVSFRVEARV
ncbi:MAG: hypothetical protein O2854_07615 [Chloroflexi bacterium]|nr:hypothetical protein [Chloroflexota bacterium]